MLDVNRTDVRVSDQDHAADLIRQMYGEHRPRFGTPRGTTAEFAVRSVATGDLRADRARNSFSFSTGLDPLPALVCSQFLGGEARIRHDGVENRFGPGDALLHPSGGAQHLHLVGFDAVAVVVPLEPVAALAGEQSGIDPAQLRFMSPRPVSTTMGRYYASVVRLLHHDLMSAHPAAAYPLINERLLQTLAVAALGAFPNSTMTAEHVPGPGVVAPAALRRALAYLEEHVAEPVRLDEVARAAGLSARALQHGFRRHFDTSPTDYLRRVRLEHAHRDLQAADPTRGDTVAEIAARWGFAKPSRFAAAYRTTYGVLPSQTLRN